jgi:prefoldin subunit 5
MAVVLDKSAIVEVGTGVLVSNTSDAVGVSLDTAAHRSTCL